MHYVPAEEGGIMSLRILLIASAASLCVAAPAGAADLATDAKAFGAREAVAAPDLSADGSSVIYITPGPNRMSYVVVGNLDTGQFSKVASSDGNPESLRWCNFASPQRSVCRITGTVRNSVFELLNFGRLISLNNDGTDPKLLGQKESYYDAWIRSMDAVVIDWLQGSDNRLLMERLYVPEEGKIGTRFVRTKQGVGVDRVDVRTLVAEPVETPRENVARYMSDGRGNVRLMAIAETEGRYNLSGRFKYLYRMPGSRDWKTLGMFDHEDFRALAIDADANQLYVTKKKDGRFALYAIRLDGSLAETLVAQNPRVDIDDVVRFGDGQRVIGYTFAEDKRSTVYFDAEFKALAASLSRVLPNLPLVGFVDSSRDGRKLLIHAGSDQDPGRYYVFDRDRKALTPAMIDRPELEGRTLAAMKPVTVTAPDGAPVPAYLTLPPGNAAKGLPAVVLPHGGPSARDEWDSTGSPNSSPRAAMRCSNHSSAARPGSATPGSTTMGSRTGGPRSATSPPRPNGSPRGALPIRPGRRSSAGPTAAMRRSSRRPASPDCSRRWWRSLR